MRFLLRKMRARKGTSRLTQRYLASTDMEGLVMTNRPVKKRRRSLVEAPLQ